nr:hypothetical protein [Oscillospiraceae bacterium]
LCGALGETPAAAPFGLLALLDACRPGTDLVCAAPDEDMPEALRRIDSRYAPELTLLFKTPARADRLAEAAPFTADCAPIEGKAAYYRCSGGVCRAPVTAF